MASAKQLYELQELDLQIETREKAVWQMTAELGGSDALRDARNKAAEEKARFDSLSSEQRALDWEIDDLSAKLKDMEKDLYSGRIKIPKELSSLQHEIAALKARRTQLEDKSLSIMEQIESSRSSVEKTEAEFKKIEIEWKSRQNELNRKIESENQLIAQYKVKKEEIVRNIDAAVLQTYQSLRKQKGYAVAKVEQGICRGCRIALPAGELANVRSGRLIQCSSCGRIMYLP
jgi:hypothetical protein